MLCSQSKVALFLLGLGLVGAVAAAQDLSDEDKQWLELVAPLILPDERETFEELKAADREEFKNIFWARRDPENQRPSPDNPFRTSYMEGVEHADSAFRVLGRKGSQTDCGTVYLLLGEPADVRKDPRGLEPGMREPETWVYRGENFAGGETSISFGPRCDLPRQSGLRSQFVKVAESKITRPNLAYRVEDGSLVSLDAQLPRPNPIAGLMEAPRQDFSLEAETKLMMRGQDGATYIGGLLRGDATGLTVREEGGRRLIDMRLGVEAVAADGSVPQSGSFDIEAEVGGDGKFVASWPLTLPAGSYTVRLGAADPATGKGSLTNLIFDAPSFSSGSLSLSDLLIFAEMRQVANAEPTDTLGAFTLGNNQIRPSFGNVFEPQEEIQVIAFCYDAPVDEGGAANVAATFEILRDGKAVSRSEEQVFDTPQLVAAVGPVPLSTFQPGEYTVRLKLVDRVGGGEEERSRKFVIASEEAAPAETQPEAQP